MAQIRTSLNWSKSWCFNIVLLHTEHHCPLYHLGLLQFRLFTRDNRRKICVYLLLCVKYDRPICITIVSGIIK